jgi:hypothetical protein
VEYSRKDSNLFLTKKIDLSALQIKNNSDKQSTVYYFENPHKMRISRLVLSFEDPRYSRGFEIYKKNARNKSYAFFIKGILSGEETRKNMHIIDLPEICDDAFRLEIFNEDNSPLTLKEISAMSPREEIVFQIPSERDWPGEEASFRIYYGNSYAHLPEYDIKNTYDKEAKHINFNADVHTKNSAFAYSIIEPPLSLWIIRALFAAGLLLTAYPGFKIFKKYAAEMNKGL